MAEASGQGSSSLKDAVVAATAATAAATGPESSYKSPLDLVSAPSSGKVTIAGRRLPTGEIVPPDIIHLQDFPAHTPGAPAAASPPQSAPPAHPGTATGTGTSDTPQHSIQETTKTAEQVYVTHASVAAAAAAAGGLVGGVGLAVRTAANVAETTVDPAAVVDFDSSSPATASTTAELPGASSATQPAPSSAPPATLPSTATQHGSGDSETPAPSPATAAGSSHMSDDAAALESASGGAAGHAVAPEDREEVASTLQRLRSAGLLQGPAASTLASSAAAEAASTDDSFVGGSGSTSSNPAAGAASPSPPPASHTSTFTAADPSMHGVSAGTAAPALAGYPDKAVGTAAELSGAPTAHADPGTGSSSGDNNSSSSNLLAMHDAVARAAAVAGALHHVGQPVPTAAVLAETATQPAQAIEAAAAAGSDEGSTGKPTAGRASSLHQQHTLADFLPDVPAAAATQDHSTSLEAAAGEQVDLSAGTAAGTRHDDLQVQLDVGRSTRLLDSDGRVTAAAATVPHEAVAAIKGDPADAASAAAAPKSPRHPVLRQLSMFADQATGSQADKVEKAPEGSGLPYGLTVADIVAATIASEERRFRVMSPRSSPNSPSDTFFTASSSGSTGSAGAPSAADSTGAGAVERSSSPLSSAATRAIFDSVQLAMQQQQEETQLAETVARSASAGLNKQPASTDADNAAAGGPSSAAPALRQMQDASSSIGTATADANPAGSSKPGDADVAAKAPTPGPAPSAADVTERNAQVMQEMLQQEGSSAAREPSAAAAAGLGPAPPAAGSSDSTASQFGDSIEPQLSSEGGRVAGFNSSSQGTTDTGSGPVSSSSAVGVGDRLAAAVAAEKADAAHAAASGADVAAAAAPAFPSAVFGLGPLPVDVPADSSSPASTGSPNASAGGASGDARTAVALASSGMAALSDAGTGHDNGDNAAEESLVQRVADAAASAAIATADEDAPATMAAAAAAAVAEQQGVASDPAAAAADAAQLVVDAANAVPGLLERSEVASAAASAGAAAAAAATPGMTAATAAIACAAAAAAPLSDPAGVGAAAAGAVAGLQDMGPDTTAHGQAGVASADGGAGHHAQSAVAELMDEQIGAADLGGVLPIMAPAGHIGDMLPVSSAVGASTAAAGTASFQPVAGQLDTVPESPGATSSGSSSIAGGSAGREPAGSTGAGEVAGTAEVLNTAGRSGIYDPFIMQLAAGSSAPLEHLGLDASPLMQGGGGAQGVLERAGAGAGSVSGGSSKLGSGALMMRPHPLAASGSFSTSAEPPAAVEGPAEAGRMYQHLAAAEEALSKLELQRQRTDSISLGAGLSSAPGELDDAALAALAAASSAQAPAGPDEPVA